ncbi:anion permease [Halorutilales archaeon Cl-col2-1]
MDLILLPALVISFFVAAVTGAVSIPVSMAPAVGSNTTGVMRAAFLVGIFGFLGAVALGAGVASGIGSNIVNGELQLPTTVIALFVIGFYVALGLIKEYPIPAAFTAFGSVAGAGIAQGLTPNEGYWMTAVVSWIGMGLAAIIISWVLTVALRRYVKKTDKSVSVMEKIILFSGIVFAFIGGGSQVGLAVGPLVAPFTDLGYGITPLLAFGGLGLLVGAWVRSPVMLNAVGRQYSDMGTRTSISILFSAIPLVQIVANVLGVPVSFNQIIINSIMGSGFAGDGSSVDKKRMVYTVGAWIASLFASFGTAYGIYYVVFDVI